MKNALQPDPQLLCKLGSIIVHAEEMISPTGHGFDKIALQQLVADPAVAEWIAAMDSMAMLTKKRTMEDVKLYAKNLGGKARLKKKRA